MTTTTAATPPQTDRRLFTVAEYMAMAEVGILHEDERIELLVGEIVRMAPIGDPHLFCTDSLTTLLVPALAGQAIVRVQGSIQLDDHTAPQPDIALLGLRDDYYAQSATPADVLLVIEAADSSLDFDLGPKAALYAAAGIPELWVANLRTGGVVVHTDPVGTEYTTIRTIPADGTISPQAFPDLVLQLREFMPPANPP